ncbi:MAG: DUF58 domain-containing protein [Acidimicrobiales bacterium]
MTGRGWAVLVGALVSMLAGRLLGLEDLYLVGAGLVLVGIAALVYVRAVSPHLEATRRVLPARVHAGSSSRVELTIVNQGRGRSPVASVQDPFDGGSRWARFLVAPLGPGEAARAAYRLPTDRRGVYDLGPLQVGVADPFGLATRVVEGAPLSQLVVFPRLDPIEPPPISTGDDPLAGADHPRALTGGGEDFYALRPYVRGDDLRKVHWPSTARTDDLMLRQDEMPWQARSTILADVRSATCPPPALELVVSAAASIVVAAARHEGLQRMVTTAGFDSRAGNRGHHADAILEHLAGVRAGSGTIVAALAGLRRSQGGGALVAITTSLASTADIQALAGLRPRFGSVTVVVFEQSAWTGVEAPDMAAPVGRGIRIVRVTASRPFAAAWATLAGAPRPTGARR